MKRLLSLFILLTVYSLVYTSSVFAMNHPIQLRDVYMAETATITRFSGFPNEPHGSCTAVLFKDSMQVAVGGDSYPYLCNEYQLFPNYLLRSGVYSVIMTDGWGDTFTTDAYIYPPLTPTVQPTSVPIATPTLIPTNIPTSTPISTPTLLPTMTPSIVPTQVEKKITSLSPLKIWLSLQDPVDLLVKFDIRAEVYKGSALISSGQKDSIPAPLSLVGAHGAKLIAIPFASFSPITDVDGSVLQLKTFVRNACKKSLRNSGSAKMWFNDKEENSQFGVVINKKKSDYFLRDNFILSQTQGSSLKTITVSTADKCGVFKPFGTWRVRL